MSTKWLHWLFALLLLTSITTGNVMTDISNEHHLSYTLPKYHYLCGLILIVLTLVRVANRLMNSRPAYPQNVSPFQMKMAKTIQWLMLITGLMLMLSGYFLATADGNPALLPWGTWLVQVLPDDSLSLHTGLLLHQGFLVAFCGFLFLHLLGFIKHQLDDRSFYKRIL
jgi:cytochrome b561